MFPRGHALRRAASLGSQPPGVERSARSLRWTALALLVLGTCTDDPSRNPDPTTDDTAAADPLQACAALASPSPQHIADVVTRINALPAPVSLACFVASLPRPLALVASTSVLSVQPAEGPESPRIFVLTGGLVLALALAGEGSHLLEMGEWVSELRTLKGELAFPVTSALAEDAPFTRIQGTAEGPTSCGFCHTQEHPHPSLEGAFESTALRPLPSTEVPVSRLREARTACDPLAQPTPRCTMLRALFDHGPVRQGAFSEMVALFFEEG